jgi:hypothetical protein
VHPTVSIDMTAMDAMEFYTLESGQEPWSSVLMNDGSHHIAISVGSSHAMWGAIWHVKHIAMTVGHAVCLCCIWAETTKL